MSDLWVERPAGAGRRASSGMRTFAVRAGRARLHRVGVAALMLAAASSATALLAGVAHAPSASFVVQCAALAAACLCAPGVRGLRRSAPTLARAATGMLVAVVALEILRSGGPATVIAAAGVVALLLAPSRAATVLRPRTLAVTTGSLLALAAAGAWLDRAELVQLAAGLAAALGIVLAGARGDEEAVGRCKAPALDAREDTIANLSHDLRNPLAIAVGFAEMAADPHLEGEERAEALDGVRRSLWEMSQLVENVLDGSADRAGALAPCREPVALESLCRDALAATQVLLRGRPIALVGSIEPGLSVVADRHGLGRVLGNLLGNAAKYTERGEIRLSAARRGGDVLLLVSDTGPGIAPEAVPFIFERFRRAHDGSRGAGLGLAIARRLTERMGGSLDVDSTLGAGTTFAVTLPRAAEQEHPTHAAA